MMTMSMNTRMMPACAAPAVTAAVSSSCSHEDPASVGHTTLSSGNSEQTRPIMAERYKTKMCRNYVETGACPYETRCMFAHGAHELRTPEMNIRDGLITEEAIRLYRRQLRHATLYSCGGCEYPAPPYVYDATYGWSYGHGGPVPMAFAYAHNPYASDVLPRECRLYSRAPTCSTTGLLPLPLPPPPQYEEEQQKRRQPCDDVVVNARTVVTAMPRARSVQRDDDDDAEFSTCSSVGSDSGEHQQFAADSVCTKQQQQLSQEDDEGTEAALW